MASRRRARRRGARRSRSAERRGRRRRLRMTQMTRRQGTAPNATRAAEAARAPARARGGAGVEELADPGVEPFAAFDFGFDGCALAAQGDEVPRRRRGAGNARGGVAPLLRRGGGVPHRRGERRAPSRGGRRHRRRAARAVAAMGRASRAGSSGLGLREDACASALKTEMCRTAFSACDVRAGNAELEYCAHAHVPSFGAAASVVGVCTRPDRLGAPDWARTKRSPRARVYGRARRVRRALERRGVLFPARRVRRGAGHARGDVPRGRQGVAGHGRRVLLRRGRRGPEKPFRRFRRRFRKTRSRKNARLVTPESAAACASVRKLWGYK